MTELFQIEPCESPRLKWLKKHRVKTKHFPHISSGDEDEFGEEIYPWEAWKELSPPDDVTDGDGVGVFHRGGATEHEAIVALAIWQGWKLWNEE